MQNDFALSEKKREKYDVVVVSGQSNAEGFGYGATSDEYVPDSRIEWLNDGEDPAWEDNGAGGQRLRINLNGEKRISVAEEPVGRNGKLGKLSFLFCREYVRNGLLEDGRKLLIVNAAVGGMCFARNEWGVGNFLYERMKDLTFAALNLSDENRIVAFLWHQGESDAIENPSWNADMRYRRHYYNLRFQTETFFSVLGRRVPFIAGGFAGEWFNKTKEVCVPVLKAINDVCTDIGGAFVSAEGLKSNNELNGGTMAQAKPRAQRQYS